jgi:hypothetical protein
MSLTGHLDVFPLEEVLRLLARSYKTGCLRVDSPDLHGRVYLNNGSLSLATVGTDDDIRRQLVSSRLVTEDAVRSAEVGGRALTDSLVPGSGSHQLSEFFREEVVESLYRIRKPGRGQFVFNVDMNPRYRSEQSFDVELCVAEADRRSAEWADVESVIPSLDLELRIVTEAPNGEPVTLAPNTWRLIAGFAGSSTVRSLAERLGISRFRAAKDLTAMVRGGLIEPAQAPAVEPAAPPAAASGTTYWGEGMTASEPEHAEPTPQLEYPEPVQVSSYLATEPVPAPDPNRSWWQEPAEEAPAAEGESAEGESPAEEATEPISETFLDRVFAQLNENPEGQGVETPTPAHGFLKRRRMSSIGVDE